MATKLNLAVEASSWIIIVAGLAVAGVAALQTAGFDAPFYDGVVAGLLLAGIGGWTAWDAARSGARRSVWASAACLLLGVWLFAFPWYLDLTTAYFQTSVLVGIAVVTVSTFEMYAAMTTLPPKPEKPAF